MTLIELLLVLAILVAVASIAAPALHGPLEDFRLRKAADLLRARCSKARVDAMRSGQTMMFRFQAGTGMFEFRPWLSEEAFLENNTPGLAAQAAVNPAQAVGGGLPAQPDALPEGVVFFGIQAAASQRDAYLQQLALQQQPDATWSPPVLFYPDGTSSTIRLVLTNERATYVTLKIRGLTGVAEVSDFLSAEELSL